MNSQGDMPATFIPTRGKYALVCGIRCLFFRLSMTNTASVCLFLCFKLIYLKVTALLFPTSDFRHPVTTPALLYISQALTKVLIVFSVFVIVCVLRVGYHKVNVNGLVVSTNAIIIPV